ncbi:Uncharacterized protein OBRU01_00558 [Operophtera brumata]|uniref:Uncharacterized protein n=1 Tax=Operophtera brumata TaxID=104452 RepID=A0A0L7LRT1_OPEBR|nr:Uncharacterized protein OBRU01_00558 [Operophtera brumata]
MVSFRLSWKNVLTTCRVPCIVGFLNRVVSSLLRKRTNDRSCAVLCVFLESCRVVSSLNFVLESYAALKELEARIGTKSSKDMVGELKMVSVSTWPAHDLLLLVRDDLKMNMEWRAKNNEIDEETDQLHKMELMTLQCKLDEVGKKEDEPIEAEQIPDKNTPSYQRMSEELAKEKSAREALKDVVSAAENMLRVARARITTLERQLKETKTDLDTARKKHKDLEQLYRHRETSYDARSKKLLEVSKTGEITIEGLARQRDALELRVKELHLQAQAAEKVSQTGEQEHRSRIESLLAKVAEQEKYKKKTDMRVIELEGKVKELEENLQAMRERSVRLVDVERKRCLEYIPSKECEPSDRETEIWKELQVTRVALSRAEDDLRQSRADKDSFLISLSKIAEKEDANSFKEKMATVLLDKEQKIVKFQQSIKTMQENEKLM